MYFWWVYMQYVHAGISLRETCGILSSCSTKTHAKAILPFSSALLHQSRCQPLRSCMTELTPQQSRPAYNPAPSRLCCSQSHFLIYDVPGLQRPSNLHQLSDCCVLPSAPVSYITGVAHSLHVTIESGQIPVHQPSGGRANSQRPKKDSAYDFTAEIYRRWLAYRWQSKRGEIVVTLTLLIND